MSGLPARFLAIILTLFCSAALGASTDNFRFRNITVADHLSDNGVNHIMQDHKGYVWIATHEGLNCYDGYRMRTFVSNPQDSTTLLNNYVRFVFEDSSRRIWVCTEAGICRYDREREAFVRYNNGRHIYSCHTVTELSDGTVMAGIGGKLFVHDPDTDRFVPYGEDAKGIPMSVRINALCQESNGTVWIATGLGVRCLDPKTRKVSLPEIKGDGRAAAIRNASMLDLRIDAFSRIWMVGWAGVLVRNPGDNSVSVIDRLSNPGTHMLRTVEFDENGNAWLGGEHGIDIYDKNLKFTRHIGHEPGNSANMTDNAVYTIFMDRARNMWIGTYFGGVNLILKNAAAFTVYPMGTSSDCLSGRAVRQIVGNDARSLWIATEDGGLNYFDRVTRQFKSYKSMRDAVPVPYYNIHSLLKDRAGNLWIGSFSGGLTRYNPATGRTTYPQCVGPDGKAEVNVFALTMDPDGDVWIGTTRGLYVSHGGADRIENVNNRFIYSLGCDAAGRVWIGTRYNGIFVYDKRTRVIQSVPSENVYQNFITSFCPAASGEIYAGTSDGGMRLFDAEGNPVRTYTARDGLLSNSVKAMTFDDNGYLWVSTSAGLSRFDPRDQSFSNYTEKDGLPAYRFNYGSAFKAEDGELFFGTTQGMISFMPHDPVKLSDPLHVEISDFSIHGNEAGIGEKGSPLEVSIAESDHIVLTNSQASAFGLTFSAINFNQAPNIVYAFSMEKSGERWHFIGKQHQLLFSSPPHGRYTLGIKASYDGQTWDEKGVRYLTVDILPPFYLTWWAYLLYLVFAGGIVYLAYSIVRGRAAFNERLNSERDAKMQAEQLNAQKMNFFANISHDLKTPLTLINGPLQKILDDTQTPAPLRDKLGVVLKNSMRMTGLLDQLLLLSRIEMGYMKVTVQQGDVLSFINRLCDIFRLFASENSVNFIVNINYKHRDVWFSPTNVERIVYNLVSNAFKFTPAGGVIRVKAYLTRDDDGQDLLAFSVEDTGIGISPENRQKIFENYYRAVDTSTTAGNGIGLALTSSLVALHHGTISVDSKEGEGTIFRVKINVSRGAYTGEQVSDVPAEEVEGYRDEFIDESNEYLRQTRAEIQKVYDNRRPVILIVEDNRELCDFVRQIFEADYEVVTAEDGVQGFEAALRAMPDLIISDVMMPGMDGFEMTRKLKSEPQTSHIPIVLLTAKAHEQDKVEGFGVGADAYIAKPFNNSRLELQVKNMINTRNNNIRLFKNEGQMDIQKVVRNPRDEKLLKSIVDLVMANMNNDNFGVGDITEGLGVSRSFLHIKLKSLVNMSAMEFVRSIKMKEAREKLLGGMNVSETSFAVGISDPNYFSKCFKKQFGQTPSEFLRSMRNNPSADGGEANG